MTSHRDWYEAYLRACENKTLLIGIEPNEDGESYTVYPPPDSGFLPEERATWESALDTLKTFIEREKTR